MAQLQQPLDTTQIDTSDAFPSIPEGWYEAIISGSDESSNKNGTGRFIKLDFTLKDGKSISTWLNYIHENSTTQDISEKHLAQILEYTGTASPLVDTQQLHNKVVDIYIKPDGTYDNISKYRKRGSVITPQDLREPASAQFDVADLEDKNVGTPDWQKK